MPMSTKSHSKEWLNSRQAEAYIGCSKPTLQRYRSEGLLPYSKVRGKVYIKLQDLNALLERNMINPPGEHDPGGEPDED
jgi:excisionase family DNA binding protein